MKRRGRERGTGLIATGGESPRHGKSRRVDAAGGYLTRMAEPVTAGEQVLTPKARAWGWPGEVGVPREQVAVSRPAVMAEREDSPAAHEGVEQDEVLESATAAERAATQFPRGYSRRVNVVEGPIMAHQGVPVMADASAMLPAEARTEKTLPAMRSERDRLPEARSTRGARQMRALSANEGEARGADRVRGERQGPLPERPRNDEENERAVPRQVQGRGDALLQSVVVERAVETKASRDDQQLQAKKIGNGERQTGRSDPAKSQGARVSIGTIEVRTVVRQAAPQIAAAPQAQIMQAQMHAASRNYRAAGSGAAAGKLSRGLGWRFGLVQG